MKIEINNLTALIQGRNLNLHQRSLAVEEWHKLLNHVEEMEQALSIADVGGIFTKEMVINVLQKRADNAFKNQPYEKRKIADAIFIIETLMPPSDFPDW